MKYFVLADIHGDYQAMLDGLTQACYEPQNKEHRIISLGDNFGRAQTGKGSKGVWEYLTSDVHTNAPVCIRGNHETILLDIFDKGAIDHIDCRNGEDKTVASFAGCSMVEITSPLIIKHVALSGVRKWIEGLPWYFETRNYIFVHGWLPDGYFYNAAAISEAEWDDATWASTPNSIELFYEDYPDGYKKTIVFGHWGTYLLHSRFSGVKDNYCLKPWIDKKHKLIGLDQATALGHKYEVLVIDDLPLE